MDMFGKNKQALVTVFKITCAVLFCVISLNACSDHDCEILPVPDDGPVGTYSFGITLAPAGIKKNYHFPFNVCLKSFDERLKNATIIISPPKEVLLEKGDLKWKGEIDVNSEKCLSLSLVSETDWNDWSAPINAHTEFIYKGEKVTGDQNWSHQDYEKRTRTDYRTINNGGKTTP